MKPSLKSIFFGEGTVPQGSAEERPLHGAPTYYYPTGRSLPKHLQDRGGKSSARKWNEDGSLLNVDELEDKQEKKKRWYDKETKNESVGVDQKGSKLSVGAFRQDSIRSATASEKSPRTTGSGRTRKRSREAGLNEINALSIVAIKASNLPLGATFKEAWEDLRDTFKEYYPHDPAVNYHEIEPGVEGEFYSITEDYYHGTNKDFAPGDYIMPPSETGEISEKGRKKNLDKVFFTLDKGSAKIYAGRAVQSFGSGSPNIYKVQPIGDIEWVNKQKGTTVLMAPMAKVIEKVSSQ